MKHKRILVVEDDSIIAAYLQDTLIRMGFDVPDIASSGEQTLQIVARSSPDLILMDIQLKGEMNGITTARRIKSEFDIPIVYLTAYSENTLIEQAMATKPSGYLLKPVNEQELHATIIMALYQSLNDKQLSTDARELVREILSIRKSDAATE